MKSMVKCRACGYVMPEGKVKDLCPACGLPKTVFEQYKDKVSEKRRELIDLHVHPIVLHFAPVFATAIVGGLFFAGWVGEPWRNNLLGMVEISILLLPISLIIAFASGLLDGKLRFKKISTPLLTKKIIAGVTFFILSLTILGLWVAGRFEYSGIMMAMGMASLGCNVFLGRIGGTLMDATLPG